jgi:hypothetical protein
MRVDGQRHAPSALPPAKTSGNRRTGAWVGPRARLEVWGKSRPPLGFDPPIVQPVAIYSSHYHTNLCILKEFPLIVSVTMWAGIAQSV